MLRPAGLDPVDVCIIGAGAGGSALAKGLAEAGMSVVVLDAGPRFANGNYPAYRNDFEVAGPRVYAPPDPLRDLTTYTGEYFNFNRVKGVGGSTLVYTGVSLRMHASDFQTRTRDGVGDDWPITYADLAPYYAAAEMELGVAGEHNHPFGEPRGTYPTPPHAPSCASQILMQGAEKLGWHLLPSPVAMPTQPWKGRRACIRCGAVTITGCFIAAKSTADVTYVRDAEVTGRATFLPNCTALEITVGSDGRARSVIYIDADGKRQEQPARAIAVAANAVETPRLLLNSASSRFPNGLANSSGLVGKRFMEHLAVFTFGTFQQRIDAYKGIPAGGMIPDFYETSQDRGFARGFTLEVNHGGMWPLSMARRIPGWGKAHKDKIRETFAHMTSLASVGEQLPHEGNTITLDPDRKDNHGRAVARITYALQANDRSMLDAIGKRQVELFQAAGAIEISHPRYSAGGSSHYMGTCRMGNDPKTAVTNSYGRCHDVPNLFIADSSVFVTSSASNPCLTIQALATRSAEYMVELGKRGEL